VGTHPEALLRAARLIERTVPLTLEACRAGNHYELGFAQRVHPGQVPVLPGDLDSLQTARGKLRYSLATAAARLERLEGWDLLGSRRQGALIAWLEGLGPKGWRQGLAALPVEAIRNCRRAPDALGSVELVLGATGTARDHGALDLWGEEDDAWLLLRARRLTHLKRAPLPAEQLRADGLVAVAAGSPLEVLATESIPDDGHDWVVIHGMPGRWALWLPDWRQEGTDDSPQAPIHWGRHGALVTPHLSVGDLLRFDMRRRPATGSKREAALLELARAIEPALAAWERPVAVVECCERHGALGLSPSEGGLKEFHSWLKRRWSGGLSLHAEAGFLMVDARAGDCFHPRGGVSPAGRCRA
jgi:hypothetical protein